MTVPHRTVRILKDPTSRVWFMTCAKPCNGGKTWCMTDEGRHPPMCYLGGTLHEADTRRLAERCGYSVVEGEI